MNHENHIFAIDDSENELNNAELEEIESYDFDDSENYYSERMNEN